MGATFSMVKTPKTGDDILAADWIAEFQNILNNLDPDGMDDASVNTAAMQATADPYPGGSPSLATDLRGEFQRIRYLIQQITGSTYWYVFPDIVAKTTTYTAALSDRVLLCDASGGAWTLTLPAAASSTDKIFHIKKTDSSGNAITIDGNASETIDGSTTQAVSNQYDSYTIVCDGSNWHIISEPEVTTPIALPKGHRSRANAIAHDTDTDHDIEIQTGEWRDAADGKNITLSSVLTKQIDSNWAAGDDAGGFPSGLSLSADTVYHVFVIYNDDDANVDGGFDTSLTATNLLSDSSYERYRRVGTVITDGSNNILPCLFIGHWARLKTPVLDVNVSNQGTTYVAYTITAPPNTIAVGNGMAMEAGSTALFQVRPVGASDATAGSATPLSKGRAYTNGDYGVGEWHCLVDGSSQIEAGCAAANSDLDLTTEGWYDPFDD